MFENAGVIKHFVYLSNVIIIISTLKPTMKKELSQNIPTIYTFYI